jgi:hypothetical protein
MIQMGGSRIVKAAHTPDHGLMFTIWAFREYDNEEWCSCMGWTVEDYLDELSESTEKAFIEKLGARGENAQ